MADLRAIHVLAQDDILIRALNEHGPVAGWRASPLNGRPESDELVIVDHDQPGDMLNAFTGPVLVLGDTDIPRPVRLGALLARIGAHLAQSAGEDSARLGPYEFVPAEQLLRGVDAVIRLTELESRLLGFLAAAGGALVDREKLLADVWGYSEGVDTHTVETHIWRLRQKIETEDAETRFLVTEAGGYRLLMAGSGQAG
jgi:hypothetical protein